MQPYFFIRVDRKYMRVHYKELSYLESVGNYVKLFTDNGVFLTTLTLKELEKILPADAFCRVNRGTIVALERIVSFDRDNVILKNASFSFSDKYRKILETRVRILTHIHANPVSILHIGPDGLKEE